MSLAPIYPDLAVDKWEIDIILLGTIYTVYQYAYLVVTPLIGASLTKIGRRNYTRIGFGLLMISMFGYIFLPYIENRTSFIVLSVIGRLL